MVKPEPKAPETLPADDRVIKPTPDNTPLPGGGRYRWDETQSAWVDQDASPGDVQA